MAQKITAEITNAILAVTGQDRAEVINKVAELLNGAVGNHMVYVASAKSIEWNGLVLDLTTRKKGGKQVVKCFYAWEKGYRKTVQMFI